MCAGYGDPEEAEDGQGKLLGRRKFWQSFKWQTADLYSNAAGSEGHDINSDPNKEGNRELTCWSPNPHVLQNVAAFKEIVIKLKGSRLVSLSQEWIAKEAQRFEDERLCEDSVRPPASQGPLVPLCFWD